MKCICVKSENMDDWYLIQRAEPVGVPGLRRTDYGLSLYIPSRITDCDIEGHASEMVAIADAIDAGESASFRRCEAERVGDGYALMSPRNDERPVTITIEEAHELAKSIRAAVAGETR